MSTHKHNHTQESRGLFREAVEHRDSGDYKEALEILRPLEQDLSDSASYLAVLADTYWELGQYKDAIDYFEKAIGIDPKSEVASLGLFHCLWEIDDTEGAFEEMRRFLSISSSKEYTTILNDINSSGD